MNSKRFSLIDCLVCLCAISYALLLFVNIDYFKVPHGDIYQYIGDAESYLKLQLPHMIQLQPLFPLLMSIVARFCWQFEFPYFASAKIINLLAVVGADIFLYAILKKRLGELGAFLIFLLTLIHPLLFITALDTTTVGLFILFSTSAIYYVDRNEKLFFILSLLAFFTRIEGILLFIVFFLQSKLHLHKRLIDRKVLISLLILLAWITFQFFHNWHNHIPLGNYYLYELQTRGISLDNFIYFFGLLGVSLFPETYFWRGINFFSLSKFSFCISIFSIVFLIAFVFNKKTRFLGIYLLLLSAVHSLFPAIEDRYFALFFHLFLIGFFSLMHDLIHKIFKNKQRVIFVIIILFFLLVSGKGYLSQFKNGFQYYRYDGFDLNYDAYKWIFSNLSNGEYYILASEDYLYYSLFLNSKLFNKEGNQSFMKNEGLSKFKINNADINFVDLTYYKTTCTTSLCLFEQIQEENAVYILISDDLLDNHPKDFWWDKNGLVLLEDFLLVENERCLESEQIFRKNQKYKSISILDMNCIFTNK